MLTRCVGIVAVMVLALAGTAHAADFGAAEIQASLDKAAAAAGAASTVVQSQAPEPFVGKTPSQIANATRFGIVGYGTTALVQGRTQGRLVQVVQSTTPSLAKTAWKATPQTAANAGDSRTNFKTRKVKGRSVLFYDQPEARQQGGSQNVTNAGAAVVDGRNVVTFKVVDANATKARSDLRKWIALYLS